MVETEEAARRVTVRRVDLDRLQFARVLERSVGRPWLFGVLAFGAVGIMRWPLLLVIAVLGPCAVFLSWKAKD